MQFLKSTFHALSYDTSFMTNEPGMTEISCIKIWVEIPLSICRLQNLRGSRDRVRTGAIPTLSSTPPAMQRSNTCVKVMMQIFGFPELKLAIFLAIYRQKSWEVIYLSKGM